MKKLKAHSDFSYCQGFDENLKCGSCLRNKKFYYFPDSIYSWILNYFPNKNCDTYIKKSDYLKNKIRKLKKLVR